MLEQKQVIYRRDYTPSAFCVNAVSLYIDLHETIAVVSSQLKICKNPHAQDSSDLVLSGSPALTLQAIRLNGKSLAASAYQLTSQQLVIKNPPTEFTLEIKNTIKPQENTSLSGLYQSSGNFCTQCEAEGFRHVTYYLDRPDVMAIFTTSIEADERRYPVLLSNGNLIDRQSLPNHRHRFTWHDPFPKPSYLFALVAGNFDVLEDKYVTLSGRTVKLQLYVNQGEKDKAHFALSALKKAMRWDEENYSREYDLDIYMIVAVDDFNAGAMENKGLNIFNSQYILVKPDVATDRDYHNVNVVVAHEYFHNWTGNRITCRDWFQLCLKEGLTVYREHAFAESVMSAAVARIEAIKQLRDLQFPEDSGALAHPVRPESYIEINNFYTYTVYEKGAEIYRMLQILLGKVGFRKGTDLYFQRHDGAAVTIDDFVSAMQDANHYDLSQFRLWYDQAGTPEITIHDEYDEAQGTYRLYISQHTPPTPSQPHKKPLLIPIVFALLNEQGETLSLSSSDADIRLVEGQYILILRQTEQVFNFTCLVARPIPSFLQGYSAPVKLRYAYQFAQLQQLAQYDKDDFNRWEAVNRLGTEELLQLVYSLKQPQKAVVSHLYIELFRRLFSHPPHDKHFFSQLLSIPSEAYLAQHMTEIDIDGVYRARELLKTRIASTLRSELLSCYQQLHHARVPYRYAVNDVGDRCLKNICLEYLMQLNTPDIRTLCITQYEEADNMTDKLAALTALANVDCIEREDVLQDFYQQWQHESLVINKWFAVQAASKLPTTYLDVQRLIQHPAYNAYNPNKVYAVLGSFSRNLPQFHHVSGEGYQFYVDQLLQVDAINPYTAARLATAFSQLRRYDKARQRLMVEQLQWLLAIKNLSKNTFEVATKILT